MVGDMVKMVLPSIANTVNKYLPKTIQLVNTDTPCRKKAKACEKTFTKTVTQRDSKNYETTSECQLFNFSLESVYGEAFNFIAQMRSVV